MSVRWSVDGDGILELDARGIVTRAGATAFRRELLPGLLTDELSAIIARFENATVAVRPGFLFNAEVVPGMVRLPGASVCRPEDLAVFREHAAPLVAVGAARVPFTSIEPAREWARRRAQAARLSRLTAPRERPVPAR